MKKLGLKRFGYHALIVLGLLLVYISADLWWHSIGRGWVSSKFSDSGPLDPFVAPPTYKEPFTSTTIQYFDRRFFIDISKRYRHWRNPLRPRKDPNGKPYFSEATFESYSDINNWFSGPLRCMGEPSLLKPKGNPNSPRFRITVIPSFDSPFSYSVASSTSSSPTLLRKVSVNGTTGDIGGDQHFEISGEIWDQVNALQDSPGFWTPFSQQELFHTMGLDGSMWLFERDAPHGHEAVCLWSPHHLAAMFERGEIETGVGHLRDFRPYAKVFDLLTSELPRDEAEKLE